MTFWLLTSEFPPVFGGGISTYCLESARMFSSFGYDVTVITQDFKVTSLTETRENGYSVVRFNPSHHYTSSFLGYEAHLSYAFAQTVQELILKKGTPDIIESQEYMGIAYYLLNYKWLKYPVFKNLNIVITLHAPSFLYLEYNKVPNYKFPYFWIGEMERFCIRAADLIISPSEYLITELKSRMKLDDVAIHIVKNPYEVNKEFQKYSTPKTTLIYFGKLIPQKGCLEVLEYFKELWNNGFKYSLVMIGGGDHLYYPEGIDMIDFIRRKYKTEIEAGQLKLAGSIHPQKIKEQLNHAKAILIPSIVDNLPYTVIEAMAEGKVVLASKQGGQAEIIDNNENGFLFDHHVEGSFKEQLIQIISLNEKSLEFIGEKAFKEIKQTYSHQAIFDQKDTLLQKLIKENNSKTAFPFIRPIKLHSVEKFSIASDPAPLLSIVVPYYNMGKYVKDTIKSIQECNYKNIEIIIVNDGSIDQESIRILDDFKNIPTIKIIHKNNKGLALARNTGALNAKGNFLAFLDPDDTVAKDYYSKAIAVLLDYHNVYFVGCWAKYFGESTGYWPAFNPEPPYLLVHNMINSSALIYKKDAFLQSGQNDPAMIYGMEDYESVINMVKNGYQGVVLPEPLWNYRVRKNSMARLFTKEKQLYLYSIITNKHCDFYSTFAPDVTKLLNSNGSGFSYDNPTLSYSPGKYWIGLIVKEYIIRKIKANRFARKTAIKIKNIYKRYA